MAKSLNEWVETDLRRVKDQPLKWLSEDHFFRDPSRPMYNDRNYLFSPADGIIIYQREVEPDECLIDIKGKSYSLRQALQDKHFARKCLVIGIFMTMYDVHVNRIPYPGLLSYKQLQPLSTLNSPMLQLERSIVEDMNIDHTKAAYLHSNQRVLNRIYSSAIGQDYYVLQIADYDVDRITPFILTQNAPVAQNQRFSQIRFGSQVDLVVPLSKRHSFEPVQELGMHIEAGIDPLVKIARKP